METSSSAIILSKAERTLLAGSVNDRFLKYSAKVKALVTCNEQLDARLKQLQNQPSLGSSHDHSKRQLQLLQKRLQRLVIEKAETETKVLNCYRHMSRYHKRIEREIEDKNNAKVCILALKKDTEHARNSRYDLERELAKLQKELHLVQNKSDKNISHLAAQLAVSKRREILVVGLEQGTSSNVLIETRSICENLFQPSELRFESCKNKVSKLSIELEEKKKLNAASRLELATTLKQLQLQTLQAEELRKKEKAFGSRLDHLIKAHIREQTHLESVISILKHNIAEERKTLHKQMSNCSRLFDDKIFLTSEIERYRQLLECEEIKLIAHAEVNSIQDITGYRPRSIGRRYNMKRLYYSLLPYGIEPHHRKDAKLCSRHNSEADNLEIYDDPTSEHNFTPFSNHATQNCGKSFQSETWSVEAIEIESVVDDQQQDDVFYFETVS